MRNISLFNIPGRRMREAVTMTALVISTGIGQGGQSLSDHNSKLPFTITVTEESYPDSDRPDYMSSKNPSWGMDFPFCAVVIEGEFWIFSKNGYAKPVYRYKGTTIENAVRQPDGTAPELKKGMYILGGVWYNAADKTLYAPLHTEIHETVKPILREIHLASSTDKGLTWKYEGPIITDNLPNTPRKPAKDFKGRLYSGGDGDHVLFADERNGYIYIFTDNYVFGGARFMRHCAVRCAIADKMAPGEWRKFYEGAWDEPGLGGKGSYVNGYCVTYNTYLKKYLSLNYESGLSVCSDLSKQDWGPSFSMGRKLWGVQGLFSMHALDAQKNDKCLTGRQFYVYGTWWTKGKRFRVDLGPGETQPVFGFTSPTMWINTLENELHDVTTANPGHMYDLESYVESSDSIEARQTRKVTCSESEVTYAGIWAESTKVIPNVISIKGEMQASTNIQVKSSSAIGSSVEFAFQGVDIYWRALTGPDQGKADVFLDGVFQNTVDCWASAPLPYQYAFIQRGVKGKGPHSIKVVVKNERNGLSTGNAITHMMFEESLVTP